MPKLIIGMEQMHTPIESLSILYFILKRLHIVDFDIHINHLNSNTLKMNSHPLTISILIVDCHLINTNNFILEWCVRDTNNMRILLIRSYKPNLLIGVFWCKTFISFSMHHVRNPDFSN